MPAQPSNDGPDGLPSAAPPPLFSSPTFSFSPSTIPTVTLNVHLPPGSAARYGVPQVMKVDVTPTYSVETFKRTLGLILSCEPDKLKLICKGRVVGDREVVGDSWGEDGLVHVVIHPSALRREEVSERSSPSVVSTESNNGWVNLGASTSASASAPPLQPAASPLPASSSTIPSSIPALWSSPSLLSARSITADSLPQDPHKTSQSYYLLLYLRALATLTGSTPPDNPYLDADTELRARVWARVYVEIVLNTDAGLSGTEGCEIAGAERSDYADSHWRTVYVDGLPYLMRVSSLPAPSEAHRKALTTLLSTQTILSQLARPPLAHPSLLQGLNGAPSQLAALLNAALAPGRPANAQQGNRNALRRVYRVTLRLPPISFIVGLFFAFLRIAFFCFILTRTGGFGRRVAVAIGAAFWAMWELQRLGRDMRAAGAAAAAQNNAGAGAGNPNPANPNADAAGGNGNPAPPAPPAPVDPNAPSPVMTYLSTLGLPAESLLLFPGLPPDPANPLRRPTVFDVLVSSPGAAEVFGFVCNVLPEYSKLRAKALAERERRVREVYGDVKRLRERRQAAFAEGTGEVVQATEEEEKAVRVYERLGKRQRKYVERVLRGDVDDVAVMWAAADGAGDEINGIMF